MLPYSCLDNQVHAHKIFSLKNHQEHTPYTFFHWKITREKTSINALDALMEFLWKSSPGRTSPATWTSRSSRCQRYQRWSAERSPFFTIGLLRIGPVWWTHGVSRGWRVNLPELPPFLMRRSRSGEDFELNQSTESWMGVTEPRQGPS